MTRPAPPRRLRAGLVAGCVAALVAGTTACGSSTPSSRPPKSSTSPLTVTWMEGSAAPGTPPAYDKVGVLEVGSRGAKNVLVLEPGTSAGSTYFVPLARWIVSRAPGWQVWSVERRENLFEDQSELDLFKEGKATPLQLFDYYLGFITNSHVHKHVRLPPNSSVEFAKQWGMSVAVQDLHVVIDAARKLGGKVVLGGHSLGGAVVTAYATWDFDGHPGADDLAGLVYIDGGSFGSPPSAEQATKELRALEAPSASPWLAFGGIPAPFAGIFSSTGAAAAALDPDAPSLGQTSGLLPSEIVPKVRVTNLAQYGYALNVGTSPPTLIAAQAHLGAGIAAAGPLHGWNGTGALTPIERFAEMFAGIGVRSADGSEWYFPQRLTDDSAAVDNGNANPAQQVLGLESTMGHDLPENLLIYAFGARLGGPLVLQDARTLAAQSGIPTSNLTLVNRQSTYAHNDPAGAYPNNVFFDNLVPFLAKVAAASPG